MGWMTKESGFDSRYRQEIYILSIAPIRALGPTKPIQWVPEVVCPELKRPGR
jgi:hypothetical protein